MTRNSNISQIITSHWCAILQQTDVNEDYTFFELGGTSITFAQLVVDLSRELGCEIELAIIFEHPTLRQFRQHVTAAVTPKMTN